MMFLISVLVGRMFINKSPIDAGNVESINIVQIDFSEIQFKLLNGIWTCSEAFIEHDRIIKIVNQWKNLLSQKGEPVNGRLAQGNTVLIYLEQIDQPIIAKVKVNQDEMRISFLLAKQEFKLKPSDYASFYPSLTKLK